MGAIDVLLCVVDNMDPCGSIQPPNHIISITAVTRPCRDV